MYNSGVQVSCIVPVYNKGQYLQEFLDSLLKQTLENIEIIFIDDISTDDSFSILRKNADKDDRIILIRSKEKLGAAKARNIGLEHATGEYLICMDADDICNERLLEIMYDKCEKSGADMGVCNVKSFTESFSSIHTPSCFMEKTRTLLASYPLLERPWEFPFLFQIVTYNPWNKMIRRKVVEEKHIRFQDLPSANDVFYSYQTFLNCSKIIFLDDYLYYYRRGHQESITAQKKEEYHIFVLERTYQYIKKGDFSPVSKISFLNHAVSAAYNTYSRDGSKDLQIEDRLVNFFAQEDIRKTLSKNYYSEDKNELLNRIINRNMDEEYMSILVNHNLLYIINMLKYLKKEYGKIGMWGCGKYGRTLLQYVSGDEWIDFLIDEDADIQREGLFGRKVYSYTTVKDAVGILLLTAPSKVDAIAEKIRNEKAFINFFTILENNTALSLF